MNLEDKTELTQYTPDEMRELCKKDPRRFDELAEAALRQACTGRTPEQTMKFQRMQWSIDTRLRKARTPLERMHVMENIFYSEVFGEKGELAQLVENCTELVRVAGGVSRSRNAQGTTAEVIEKAEQKERKTGLYLVKG